MTYPEELLAICSISVSVIDLGSKPRSQFMITGWRAMALTRSSILLLAPYLESLPSQGKVLCDSRTETYSKTNNTYCCSIIREILQTFVYVPAFNQAWGTEYFNESAIACSSATQRCGTSASVKDS
eukprot:2079436-Amphidinium_carterae.1